MEAQPKPDAMPTCPVCDGTVYEWEVQHAHIFQDPWGYRGGPGHAIGVGGAPNFRAAGGWRAVKPLPSRDVFTFQPCGHEHVGRPPGF